MTNIYKVELGVLLQPPGGVL